MLLYGTSDVDHRRLKTPHFQQGCAFRGCEQCSPTFWESKAPQNWNFGTMNSTVNRECLFARSLLPRVYIAECFWFFCVVVEVQKVPFGSRAFLRLLVGELGTPKIAQILLWEMPVYIHSYTTQSVWSGPKTAQNVSFRAAICLFRCRCEWCSPKFWVNTPKTEILVPWIGLSIVNDKKSNAYNFNTAMPIMTKFLHGIAPVNGPSWVVPRRPHKNTENGDGGHIEFRKKC